MTHKLVIARHGNTFFPNETPRRVGGRTDIPLVPSGKDQALRMGDYMRNYNMFPDRVVAADLMRTRETAKLATDVLSPDIDARFNEIDYGPDENQEEAAVIDRIGEQAIQDWNEKAIVPSGWNVDTNQLITHWMDFADEVLARQPHTTMVVTSNGIARFAPYITGDFRGFSAQYDLKLATGALGVFENHGEGWICSGWNIRP